jgi:hypothetical protein
MRTSMTTLTQVWMTFLLSNILPSDHTSDLIVPKCFLVYSCMSGISIDIAGIISDAIRQFVMLQPAQFPSDPNRANRALGFPALITGLCASRRVHTHGTKPIRPPITITFIEKFCTAPQVDEPQPHAQPQHPQPPPQAPPPQTQPAFSLAALSERLHRMELMQTTYFQRLELQNSHIIAQQAANHRGQVHLHQSYSDLTQQLSTHAPAPYHWPTLEQFHAHVAWPGDSPIFTEGVDPMEHDPAAADHQDGHDAAADEDMHQPQDDII